MSCAGAIILLLLIDQPASDKERKADASRFLVRGNQALEGGDPVSALEAYRAAYDAFPSPKIFFNMAEAHLELGQLVEAADLYQRVTTELPSDSRLVRAAKEKLAELDRQLGRVSIATKPPGARIEIGGRDMGSSPIDEMRVPPGSIEIRATAEERSEVQTIEVEAGGSHALRFDLVEVVPPPVVEVETAVEEEDDPVTAKWWFWTAVVGGVVVAGSVTAAVIATQRDGFVLTGELGNHSLEEFQKR